MIATAGPPPRTVGDLLTVPGCRGRTSSPEFEYPLRPSALRLPRRCRSCRYGRAGGPHGRRCAVWMRWSTVPALSPPATASATGLIRPDGYLGYLAASDDVQAVASYLTDALDTAALSDVFIRGPGSCCLDRACPLVSGRRWRSWNGADRRWRTVRPSPGCFPLESCFEHLDERPEGSATRGRGGGAVRRSAGLVVVRVTRCADGVVQAQAHGRMHGQVGDVGGVAPADGVGLDPVRSWRFAVIVGGDGVEAQGELLVDAAVGVDQDVAGVAVDPGDRGEFDGDPGFLGDLADDGLPGGLADLDPASGELPVAIVDAADQQDLPGGVADCGERGGQQV